MILTVEETAVGGILAEFSNRPGVLAVDYNITELVNRKRLAEGEGQQRILDALKTGPLTRGEIAEKTELAQASLQTHLSRMKIEKQVQKVAGKWQLPKGAKK